jgi:aryl-alcohol dehydrogenase-like predicted oxidoreductase
MEKGKKLDRRRFIKNSFMSAFGGGIYINSVNRSSIVGNFFTKGESNQKKEGDSKIEYRKLGKIGYNASLLGFGAMITTDPSVLVKALDMGINYVDTARGYQRGNNEVWVGKVVKNRRKNLFLTTKQKPGNIIEGAEESLKALDTDYVDGLLGHGLGREEVLSENVMSSLEKLKKERKKKYIGASVH